MKQARLAVLLASLLAIFASCGLNVYTGYVPPQLRQRGLGVTYHNLSVVDRSEGYCRSEFDLQSSPAKVQFERPEDIEFLRSSEISSDEWKDLGWWVAQWSGEKCDGETNPPVCYCRESPDPLKCYQRNALRLGWFRNPVFLLKESGRATSVRFNHKREAGEGIHAVGVCRATAPRCENDAGYRHIRFRINLRDSLPTYQEGEREVLACSFRFR